MAVMYSLSQYCRRLLGIVINTNNEKCKFFKLLQVMLCASKF